ncbi:MAG: thiamine-phosphate kinase [Prosthecobacter sp.]|nr:thiamine-phosphate kinase [Prosthecobacter sp.]
MSATLADIGEDALVRLITRHLRQDADVLLGPGDDCAVVRPPPAKHEQVLKTDTLVEGVHFTPTTPPRLIGRKALARVLSDFAAMAATPRHALVTLIAPPTTPVARVRAIYQGLSRLARDFGVCVVGGETSRGSQLILSVSMSGHVKTGKWITRSAARPGDVLYVTGRLGGSLRGWHLRFHPLVKEAAAIAQHLRPTAMMDLSDGLARDLPRLAASCGLGLEWWPEKIPLNPGCTLHQALHDGEDYQLLLALPPSLRTERLAQVQGLFPRLRFFPIGCLLPRPSKAPAPRGGWDHFGRSP